MQCPKCSKNLPADAYFCGYCGTTLRPQPPATPRVHPWVYALGGAGVMFVLALVGLGMMGGFGATSTGRAPVVQTVIVPQVVVAEITRVVPQTVVAESTRIVVQTAPVPQTVIVQQTVPVPQTVIVERTVIVQQDDTPIISPEETIPPDETETMGIVELRGTDNAPMVFVPAGEFTMGSNKGDEDEKPPHLVYLDAFWIDQHEVTNSQYKQCADAGKCQQPPNVSSETRDAYYGTNRFADYPVVYVSWNDARVYCEWAGKHLPTEAEWEKAARGIDAWVFPWGDSFEQDRLNSAEGGLGDTAAVGSYPSGSSPYGALDMAGNVWEWVNDWYESSYYAGSPTRNPKGPTEGQYKALRGGSFWYSQAYARAANRNDDQLAPDIRNGNIGFRCAE